MSVNFKIISFSRKKTMLFLIFLFGLLSFNSKADDNNIHQVSDIPIEWVNCSTWTDQLAIEKVEANTWLPKRNASLIVSVSGVAKESFIYGNYNKTIVYRGYSLPSKIGPLDDLGIKLPTHPGPLKMILINSTIPDVAPDGQYDIYIKASEQDHFEIFCIKISWTF